MSEAIQRVGFVGLGNMGTPMSRNLAAAGYALTLGDLDGERRARLAAETGSAIGDSPQAFAGVQALITMLPTGADVRTVLLEWGGGLAAALHPGTIVIDMSSSDAVGTRELGAELAARGLVLIDAPVSGGVSGASAGSLAVMVGGEDAQIDRVDPILAALGGRILRVGPLGSGHAVKALNNYVAAACFTASCEALIIGAGFGLEPDSIVAAINGSTGRNFNTELTITPHVIERAFATGFSLRLMAKDLGLAQALAQATGTQAPTCELMAELWAQARDGEGPESDFTTAARYWERLNGREIAPEGA
ncbi:MAG TPA: NAD(P)-dependent oxidoreductase [Solirubrobacteraceae bacterium]|nr:NAD(P)-dependent oxidoreductase [Solirubrobacteraceae bacterium]